MAARSLAEKRIRAVGEPLTSRSTCQLARSDLQAGGEPAWVSASHTRSIEFCSQHKLNDSGTFQALDGKQGIDPVRETKKPPVYSPGSRDQSFCHREFYNAR